MNKSSYIEDMNTLYWYVITNNTSWCSNKESIVYGPFGRKDDALLYCTDDSYKVVLLNKMEAASMSY